MADREKVIRGLEACAYDSRLMQCENCPYHADKSRCVTTLMRDALALLKEQEARVMSLEEMEMREESCFLEVNGDDGAIVLIQNVDCGGLWDFLSTTPGFLRHSTWQAVDYGTTWRCWSARPTPEQMRDTPWEES